MTPRLWEDVLELQKQAKLKDNVIFSAQGALNKSLGTYFGSAFFTFFNIGLKYAFLRLKKAKIEKSKRKQTQITFLILHKNISSNFFGGAPLAEKMILSLNFACF